MENEKQYSKVDGLDQGTKIKTNFARITVGCKAEKPYYDILYFDPADGKYHIGFGSYYLEYVFKWLSEEFEITDVPVADHVPVVRCRDCKHRYTENCPMYFHDSCWSECYGEYIDDDTDHTEDGYFCPKGEMRSE